MEIAARIGCSKREAKLRVGSSELADWRVFLHREANAFNPLFYYLAQIAAEVRRTKAGKRARGIKIKDFILKFTSSTPTPAKPKSREEATKLAQARWFGIAGIRRSDNG